MKNIFYKALVFFFVLISVSGCSIFRKTANTYDSLESSKKKEKIATFDLEKFLYSKKAIKKELDEKEILDFKFCFSEAAKQKMLGNYDEAISYYFQCLRIDRLSAASMYELAVMSSMSNDNKTAIILTKRAVEISPKNYWYYDLLSQLYIEIRDYEDATKCYEKMILTFPERADLPLNLAQLYIKTGKPNNALQIFDRIEAQNGVNEDITAAKCEIYSAQGETEKIYAEYQKLIAAHPDQIEYYGMLAEAYSNNKSFEQARKVYEQMQKIAPENPLVHISLANFYRAVNEPDKVFAELKFVFEQSDFDVTTKLRSFILNYSYSDVTEQNSKEGEELLDILQKIHPSEASVYLTASDFYAHINNLDKSRTQIRKALAIEKDNYQIWEQLINLNIELNDFKSLLDDTKQAIEYYPLMPRFYLLNGLSSFQLNNFQAAIDVLQQGADLVVDDNQIKEQFLIYLGESFYKLKNYEKSYSYFDAALAINPNNVMILNNYSYYLSLSSENLTKAEQMSKKTIEIEPRNGTYLDTYAWVLYKMKNYAEARLVIEKAILNGKSDSPVIIEHYGDILYKMGNIEDAKTQWNKALQIGKGSEFLEEKVSKGTLIE